MLPANRRRLLPETGAPFTVQQSGRGRRPSVRNAVDAQPMASRAARGDGVHMEHIRPARGSADAHRGGIEHAARKDAQSALRREVVQRAGSEAVPHDRPIAARAARAEQGAERAAAALAPNGERALPVDGRLIIGVPARDRHKILLLRQREFYFVRSRINASARHKVFVHRIRERVRRERADEAVVVIIIFDCTVGEHDALALDPDVVRPGEQGLQVQMNAAAVVERLNNALRRELLIVQDLNYMQHGAVAVAVCRRGFDHNIFQIGAALGIGRNVVPDRLQAVFRAAAVIIIVARVIGHRIAVLHEVPRADRPCRLFCIRGDVEQRLVRHRAAVFAIPVKDVEPFPAGSHIAIVAELRRPPVLRVRRERRTGDRMHRAVDADVQDFPVRERDRAAARRIYGRQFARRDRLRSDLPVPAVRGIHRTAVRLCFGSHIQPRRDPRESRRSGSDDRTAPRAVQHVLRLRRNRAVRADDAERIDARDRIAL